MGSQTNRACDNFGAGNGILGAYIFNAENVGFVCSRILSIQVQGPKVATTGTLPGHFSKICENMEKWGELGENESFSFQKLSGKMVINQPRKR